MHDESLSNKELHTLVTTNMKTSPHYLSNSVPSAPHPFMSKYEEYFHILKAFEAFIPSSSITSSLNHKFHNHARSNSLPSKPHPLILQCNERLSRLGAYDTISSSLLRQNLTNLLDLHGCIEKLVQLPLTQQALVQECQEKWVDDLLDGSLRLLDACTATKDALLHTKECTRELQSTIRRRRGGEVELTLEVKKFLTSRKVVRKAIFKALENLKGNANKGNLAITNYKDYQTMALVNLLKEAEVITFSTFESLLNFFSGSTQAKRISSWALVSKLMHNKRVGYAQGADENEFAKVDAAFQLFAFNMSTKSNDDISDLLKKLENLGTCIPDLEEGLESLFRRLIKIRKMAPVETSIKSSLHSRSNSLPNAPHPILSQVEVHLHRLKKDPEATTSLSSSSSSISHRLNDLQDLQESADKLLQLTISQQGLAQECRSKQIDELLDRSLRLLDICSTIKDCLLQSKDSMHELGSVIRRKRDAETGFTTEGGKYLACRKKMKRAIAKALRDLKAIQNKFTVSSSNKDEETSSMLSFLKEAEMVTMSSFESLLIFIIGPKGQLKQSRWSVISKLVQPKRISCDSEVSDTNKFKMVDKVLKLLIGSKPSSTENFQSHVQNLELCIQDIEVGVERLSRQLIRTRVTQHFEPLVNRTMFLTLLILVHKSQCTALEKMHIACDSQESHTNKFEGNTMEVHRWIFERIKGNRKMRFGVYSRIRKKSEDEITIIESVKKMALVETNMKSSLHNRSNSMPTAPRPTVSQVEEHLHRLKDTEATTSSLSSSISHRLNDLQDLQESTDELLQLRISQQALAQECSSKQIDELLDGTVKDCLLQSKDSMHELVPVIRRKRDAEMGSTIEGGKYLACRKKMKREIAKALRDLKAIKNEFTVQK
ncbi:hypothetical protein GmHk_04G009174 [Glycine max]|nr:hypothetical protein GmHk_04G009174 [Glycine max]